MGCDSKMLWHSINDVLGRFRKKHSNEFISADGTVINNATNVGSEFVKYFNNIPNAVQSGLNKPVHNYEYLIPINNGSILFAPASDYEILCIIFNLKNKGTSLNLPAKFLKHVGSEISPILSKLFNLCLTEGVYPDCLKIARIIPLFKS